MAASDGPQKGRTNPPGNDDDSGSEDDYKYDYPDGVEGRYRARVKKYDNPVRFPTASTYQEGEEVYLQVAGQQQPAGPYIVVAVLANEMYIIKSKSNDLQHPSSVSAGSLLVKY